MVKFFFQCCGIPRSGLPSSGPTWRIVSGPWMEQHDLVKAQQYLGIKKVFFFGMKVVGVGVGIWTGFL